MTPERTQTLLCRHSRRELDHLFTGIVHGVRMLRTEGSTHVDIITRAGDAAGEEWFLQDDHPTQTESSPTQRFP